MDNPKILITSGDPNSISPEIILKVFATNITKKYNLKVIGEKSVFDYYARHLSLPEIRDEFLVPLDYKNFKVKLGKITATGGEMSGDAIKKAIFLCRERVFDAVVTMPVSKEALTLGGYKFRGHTEMLSRLLNTRPVVMIMYSKRLIVIPLTIHIPLKKVAGIISAEFLILQMKLLYKILQTELYINHPQVAVLSLNPHSGDNGLIGTEEVEIITPVISGIKKLGYNFSGPYSADGFFGNKKYFNFDAVICFYHDQAMIPFKIIAGNKGVNYTGGLPIVRTSPAHGTAFDIAGKGIAKIESTVEAIKLAHKLAKRRYYDKNR
ncbi:MAG: 4-hydroxythreonine-4-phosphate dehydrogenase PdxA [Ignavibacteria bacterium]